MKKRGKPVTHPKVIDTTTGYIYNTYTEAANAINGCRVGVMRTCIGIQKHHHNHIFRHEEVEAQNEKRD